MRNIDDIIANTSKLTEAALREAFDAGRASAATELKSKIAAFFEGLVHTNEPHAEVQPVPAEAEHHQPEPEHQHHEPEQHQPEPEQHQPQEHQHYE